jgi:hypothetical protein
MTGTQLSIQFYETSQKTKLDAILTPDQSQKLELITVNVVQGMTGNGRTGLIFQMIDTNTGKKYHFKTTSRIIVNGVAPAAMGFMTRVGDDPMLP